MNRRGFLQMLLAAVPAVALADPALKALAAAVEKGALPKLPTWIGGAHYPAGRHVVAWLDGPAKLDDLTLEFAPDLYESAAKMSVVRRNFPSALLFQVHVGPGYSYRWCAAGGDEILCRRGDRLGLVAELPCPGYVGGILLDSAVLASAR